MPEANYSFKPSPDVRSFGEILAHVAGASYVFCAAAKGEKSPFAEEAFEKTATTKAAIVKVTNDAIAYCDGAYTAATDATLGQMVAAPFGSGQVAARQPAHRPDRPQQRALRQPDHLLPHQGHGPAVLEEVVDAPQPRRSPSLLLVVAASLPRAAVRRGSGQQQRPRSAEYGPAKGTLVIVGGGNLTGSGHQREVHRAGRRAGEELRHRPHRRRQPERAGASSSPTTSSGSSRRGSGSG